MKKFYTLFRHYAEAIVFAIEIVLIIIFTGCVSSELRISEFNFVYDNTDYLVRSAYCPGNPESCNQIIGESFIAVDMNQDRVVDKITHGDITLNKAQEIYDYCLGLLENQNKLSKVDRVTDRYFLSEQNFDYEIKTFTPQLNSPINEFTITDKRNEDHYKISILSDTKADGILDELIKGTMPLKIAQTHYQQVISDGLNSKKLEKVNGSILIK